MASDPFAKYLTPPAGPTSSEGGADPYAKYLTQPGAGGVTAAPVQPSDMDYSNSPWSALGRTFESSATLGVGDLIRAAATGKKPSETAAQSSAAAASLPWYIRYPTEAVGYGLGAANLLNPVADVAEGGAAALGAGAGLARIAGTAAEGAGAGAISHVAGSDDPGLADTTGAALGGAALGGAAGAAAPLVNKGLTKAFGKAGTVDPAQAIAATKAAKTALYDATEAPTAPQFAAKDFQTAYTQPIGTLTRLQQKDVSEPFQNLMQSHINDAVVQKTVSPGDINYYVQDLQSKASNDAERVLAGRVRDSMVGENGYLATAQPVSEHPVGQAYNMLQAANKANAQYENAKALGQLQQQLKDFGQGPGNVPQTQAETYYKPGEPGYEAWSDVAAANKPGVDPRYVIAHTGGEIGSDAGALLGGFPGMLVGRALGMLGGKAVGKKIGTGWQNKAALKSYQEAYPTLTGVQPTGGRTVSPWIGDTVGNSIKNLMMGNAY